MFVCSFVFEHHNYDNRKYLFYSFYFYISTSTDNTLSLVKSLYFTIIIFSDIPMKCIESILSIRCIEAQKKIIFYLFFFFFGLSFHNLEINAQIK